MCIKNVDVPESMWYFSNDFFITLPFLQIIPIKLHKVFQHY